MAAYYSLMVESAIILGADRHEAETQMLDVLNFETQLANVSSRSPTRTSTGREKTGMKSGSNYQSDANKLLPSGHKDLLSSLPVFGKRQPAATTPEADH